MKDDRLYLIHVDLDKVWNIVTRNLPDLKTKTEAIMASLGPAP
jgi:uncharacterized protein with HEPN domain